MVELLRSFDQLQDSSGISQVVVGHLVVFEQPVAHRIAFTT